MRRLICRQLAGWRAPDKCRLLFRAFTTAPSSKEERKKKIIIIKKSAGSAEVRAGTRMLSEWGWQAVLPGTGMPKMPPATQRGAGCRLTPCIPLAVELLAQSGAAVLPRPHPARLGSAASTPRQRAPPWGAGCCSPHPGTTGYTRYKSA